MAIAELVEDTVAVDLARECVYRFLATALRDPSCADWRGLLSKENQRLALLAGELLRDEAAGQDVALGFGERAPSELDLQRTLVELAHSSGEQSAEYDRVFGLVIAKECAPYETEYYPAKEAFQRSQQLADVAGFYRAFGIGPSTATPERPDHISLELEFMAFLIMKKRLAAGVNDLDVDGDAQTEICDEAARKFFTDHLAWWVPAFATGLRRKASCGLYAALADLLAAWIPTERGRMGVPPARMPVEAVLIESPEEQSACSECVAL